MLAEFKPSIGPNQSDVPSQEAAEAKGQEMDGKTRRASTEEAEELVVRT